MSGALIMHVWQHGHGMFVCPMRDCALKVIHRVFVCYECVCLCVCLSACVLVWQYGLLSVCYCVPLVVVCLLRCLLGSVCCAFMRVRLLD